MSILSWLFGGGDKDQALRDACKENVKRAKSLIEQDADVEATGTDGMTPLAIAAINGQPEIVAALLQAGADPNAKSIGGLTPIGTMIQLVTERWLNGTASERRYRSCPARTRNVKLLLDAGADVEEANDAGYSNLMFAAKNGDIELAKCFLDANADVNLVMEDYAGEETALSLAAAYGHASMARLLLENGADVNFQSQKGAQVTPLMHAAMSGHADVVRELLSAGADKSLKTTESVTAIEMARTNDHQKVVEMLK